jgi:HTH-like domain
VRRGPYAKVVERNAQLLERIRDLKAEHPFWGYRRIWAYLRYVDGLIVNQKRIYGVMKVADLLVSRTSSSAPDARSARPSPGRLGRTSGGASI